MKLFSSLVMAAAPALLLAGPALAQGKPTQQPDRMIPLKVEVVLSEYDGAKKISTLPYTVEAKAVATGNPRPAGTQLRLGVRVPIQTGDSTQGHSQWQYLDVGTNIDCSARALEDDTYEVVLEVDRSSVYLPGGEGQNAGLRVATAQPIVRQFRVSNTLLLKDGQTDESTVASDPFSGHQMRVTVTLHVVK